MPGLRRLGGNDQEERRSLLALVAEEPGNTTAWARLAELARKAGRRDEARIVTARSKPRRVAGGIATIGSSCTMTGAGTSTNWHGSPASWDARSKPAAGH